MCEANKPAKPTSPQTPSFQFLDQHDRTVHKHIQPSAEAEPSFATSLNSCESSVRQFPRRGASLADALVALTSQS